MDHPVPVSTSNGVPSTEIIASGQRMEQVTGSAEESPSKCL